MVPPPMHVKRDSQDLARLRVNQSRDMMYSLNCFTASIHVMAKRTSPQPAFTWWQRKTNNLYSLNLLSLFSPFIMKQTWLGWGSYGHRCPSAPFAHAHGFGKHCLWACGTFFLSAVFWLTESSQVRWSYLGDQWRDARFLYCIGICEKYLKKEKLEKELVLTAALLMLKFRRKITLYVPNCSA